MSGFVPDFALGTSLTGAPVSKSCGLVVGALLLSYSVSVNNVDLCANIPVFKVEATLGTVPTPELMIVEIVWK